MASTVCSTGSADVSSHSPSPALAATCSSATTTQPPDRRASASATADLPDVWAPVTSQTGDDMADSMVRGDMADSTVRGDMADSTVRRAEVRPAPRVMGETR